jgi:hypothetical protein
MCLQGPLGDVLDTQQLISDVSGAGNNWGHGHHVYGPQYHEQVMKACCVVGFDLCTSWMQVETCLVESLLGLKFSVPVRARQESRFGHFI